MPDGESTEIRQEMPDREAPIPGARTADTATAQASRKRRVRRSRSKSGEQELRKLLAGLQALDSGDFSVRLDGNGDPLMAELFHTFNRVAAKREAFTKELVRVSAAVGREGRMDERMEHEGGGGWGLGASAVNALVSDLVQPTTEVARVLDAVAQGDPVSEVDDKDPVLAGHVYVAPADYHLLMEDGHFSLSTEEPYRYSRPSIDVTFEAAAREYGSRAGGVVLTGANDDGALGLRQIVKAGGRAIVQDPATAESPIMPRAALRAVPDAEVLPVERIGARLCQLEPVENTTRGRKW